MSPSTLAPLLIAVGAQAVLFGPAGERRVELEKLYRTPQKEGEREHDLRPGEILTEVLLPPAAGRKIASYEVRQRETLDWSLATASVALEMDAGRQGGAGAGGARPGGAGALGLGRGRGGCSRGKPLDAALAAQAADAAVQKAFALAGNRYKIQLARVAVKRALIAAAGIVEDDG